MNQIGTPEKKHSFWRFLALRKKEPEVVISRKESAIVGLVSILFRAMEEGVMGGHDGLMVVKRGVDKFTQEAGRQIQNGVFKDIEEIKSDRKIKKAFRLVHNYYTANKVTDQKVRDTLESLAGSIFELGSDSRD